MEEYKEYLLKITVLGTPIKQIGEIITNFTQQEWGPIYVGIDASNKKIQVDNNNIKLILVSSTYPIDTISEVIIGSIFRGASALIFAFDKSDIESYVFATTKLPKITKKYLPHSKQDIPTVLLGFKTSTEAITTHEAIEEANKKKWSYYELDIDKIVSSLPNEEYNAMEEVFRHLIRKVLEFTEKYK